MNGELTEAQRTFLRFMLNLALDDMCYNDGFTDEDQAAFEFFRSMANPGDGA